MDRVPALPPGNSSYGRLIEALRRKDPELNAYASEILVRLATEMGLHKQLVRTLVQEACRKGKQPDHRIRILDVIQRIGEPLDAESFFDLMFLCHHRVPRLGKRAGEVIAALRPSGGSVGVTTPMRPRGRETAGETLHG
jgi:hypothetical protein